MTVRNLILSGGIYHPFAETSASIAGHLDAIGIASEIVDVDAGLTRLAAERFDLLTVNALAFSMTQAEKYVPLRDAHAFSPSEAQRAALRAHLERGGGLLGLHTAAICFDTWPDWPNLLGVGWVWGRSHHPAPDYLTVTSGGDRFTVWDELYCDLEIGPDCTVLATATVDGIDQPQPVMTARRGAAYLALGHDLTATANPGYVGLIKQAAGLALNR